MNQLLDNVISVLSLPPLDCDWMSNFNPKGCVSILPEPCKVLNILQRQSFQHSYHLVKSYLCLQLMNQEIMIFSKVMSSSKQ